MIDIPKRPLPVEDFSPVIANDYLIGPGDEIEVIYYIEPAYSVDEYIIDTEDTIRIDFYYYPVMSKTVSVRPDGYVTLQRVGDVMAAGKKPRELSEIISNLFKPYLLRPFVTVELIEFNVKVEKLKKTITTTTRGQSKLALVRPDGKIALPYTKDVTVAGLTGLEISRKLEDSYRQYVKNIGIAVSVLKARSNRSYIMGEVKRSNYYELRGPITLTQFIATAGGFTEEANTHQIVLIRRGKDGTPVSAVYDMDDIIGKGNIDADPVIRQYDVIFVPKTTLASVGIASEALWNMIPWRFSSAYSLGSIND